MEWRCLPVPAPLLLLVKEMASITPCGPPSLTAHPSRTKIMCSFVAGVPQRVLVSDTNPKEVMWLLGLASSSLSGPLRPHAMTHMYRLFVRPKSLVGHP
jgi:hypothetical protein